MIKKEFVRRVKLILQQTLDNIVEAQRRQEKHHNKERRYFECKINAFGVKIKYKKIQPVSYGPYRLVKKINDNACEVDLSVINWKDRELNVQWTKFMLV
ncbi:Transposon Ty3-I Gag-Pol polyprotein [Pichia kudriavzevii]|uniref:Transposon Ty3-I Gag-Pol polyprotein n=1 Tax=Pichia kudriavzevii TaxID=4909 RepID=A0A1V2LLC8_PICKU|nr:Transposon Ty3-I Gag-Pol polyprotein [Pichia kudriavzevii]